MQLNDPIRPLDTLFAILELVSILPKLLIMTLLSFAYPSFTPMTTASSSIYLFICNNSPSDMVDFPYLYKHSSPLNIVPS